MRILEQGRSTFRTLMFHVTFRLFHELLIGSGIVAKIEVVVWSGSRN